MARVMQRKVGKLCLFVADKKNQLIVPNIWSKHPIFITRFVGIFAEQPVIFLWSIQYAGN